MSETLTAVSLPPGGQPVELEGVGEGVVDAAATTAVGVVVAVVDPSALVAVTWARSVLSRSTVFKVYVVAVAPEMFEQLPPSLSQRSHWYA